MTTPDRFRILLPLQPRDIQRFRDLGCPDSVPWSLVAPHEAQARRNHGQTLLRLNQRGGLDPAELVAVLEGKGLEAVFDADTEQAILRLKELLTEHDSKEVPDA